MNQPTIPPAPASPPAPSSGQDLRNQFLLSGKSIAVLFLAALILAALTLFADIFGQLSLIVLALAICALCYRLRLAMRILICALVLVGISLYVARPMLSETFYDAGLLVLSSYGDPGERGFWPDPAKMDLPDTVVTEVPYGDGLEGFATTTDEGRAGAIAGLKYENGAKYLEYAAAALLITGLVIACLGTALRLLGITREPPSTSGEPGLFERINQFDRVGLIMVTLGWIAFLTGLLPQELINNVFEKSTGTYGGTDYLRGEGILWDAKHLFLPMMILDKVEFIGTASLLLGILTVLLGTPRRILCRRGLQFWRRANEEDVMFKNVGVVLMAFGGFVYVFNFLIFQGFLIPTIREIGIIATGNWDFFPYPGWLVILDIVTGAIAIISAVSGMISFLLGSRSARFVGNNISRGLDKLEEMFPTPPPSSGGSSGISTSGGGSREQPTGHGGMLRASRGGRGGRGGGR